MKIDLTPCNVVVFVFGMPECPACENYIPRFVAAVAARQAKREPFIVCEDGDAEPQLQPGLVPVVFLDVATDDKTIQDLADRLHVSGTPATVVMTRGAGSARFEGALPGGNIEQILDMALERR
jgi:thioredoxin-like negative regulator of GroEL